MSYRRLNFLVIVTLAIVGGSYLLVTIPDDNTYFI